MNGPEIVLSSAFEPAYWVAQIPEHDRALVVVLKATYEFSADGEVSIAEEQDPLNGDVPYPDDEDAIGAPRYASDLEPFRPSADLLCVGHARPPEGPAPTCDVAFRVGDWTERLRVSGNREWKGTMLTRTPSEPEAFEALELRYDNAFGGPGFKSNPIGVGYAKTDGVRGLPNVERPGELVESPRDQPKPAGFGPLHRTWEPRQSKLGTYKKAWLQDRWPYLADDLDWSYFNASPANLSAGQFLRGDELVELRNLVEGVPACSFRLPGARGRAFVETKHDVGVLQDTQMRLDTLWVDADAGQFVLVWRGHIPLPSGPLSGAPLSRGNADEVVRVFFMDEPLDAESTPEQVRELMATSEAVDGAELQPPVEVVPLDPSPDAADEPLDIDPDLLETMESERERINTVLTGNLQRAHANLGTAATDLTPEQEAQALQWFEKQGIVLDPPDAEEPAVPEEEPDFAWTRETVIDAAKSGSSLVGQDLSGLDLSELDLRTVDLSQTILVGTVFRGAQLDGARLVQAQCDQADFGAARMSGADLSWADCTGAEFAEAVLDLAHCEGAIFEGANLAGVSLRNMEAARAVFADAHLTGADLTGSGLEGALFVKARIDGARFCDARMAGASIEGAVASAADFSRALMPNFRASESTNLTDALFLQVHAAGSMWNESDLTGADFSSAHLAGAQFVDARLDGANLTGADAGAATFLRASLRATRLVKANLMESIFESADLTGADLSSANAYGAEFFEAIVSETNRTGTNLTATKLSK